MGSKVLSDVWYPIETAPVEGREVDVLVNGARLDEMRYVDLGQGNTFFEAIRSGYCCVRNATHWRPRQQDPTKT